MGSNLALEFLKQGCNLKLLIRNKDNNAEQRTRKILSTLSDDGEEKEYMKSKDRIEIIPGDITIENLGINSDALNKLSKEVNSVFHCAALTSFDESKQSQIQKCNIDGTKNVLEFTLKTNNPDFHFVSTAYVCGQKKGIFYEDELDVGQEFSNFYEKSKLEAEKLISKYQKKFDFNTTIYRPAIIVGDSKTGKTSNFLGFYSLIKAVYLLVKLFKEDMEKGGKRALKAGVSYRGNELYIPIRVPAVANKTLNIVPIDYVLSVIMRIFKRSDKLSKVYHLVNPNPPTIGYLHKTICSIFNVSGISIEDPREFQVSPMSPWEEFFAEYVKVFSPYLQKEEPIFSDRNTKHVLNGTSIKCPIFSERVIERLVAYCIKGEWGSK